MPKSPDKFAELLTKAVRIIKANNPDKTLAIIQDELGYAIDMEGGACIEEWRKGRYTPGKQTILEKLTEELLRRGGLTKRELIEFLNSGDHPDPISFTTSLLNNDGAGLSIDWGEFDDPVGPLSVNHQGYIEREADPIFKSWVKQGIKRGRNVISIRASGQAGKSSFLTRGLNSAKQDGGKILLFNLQEVNEERLSSMEIVLA
jgi:hypothetical protein